ncbi:MAG: sel1 repeat family protein, partial [Thermoguttaceae bacterium]|nr:sel1 repeat family protein [Thermoguttaceae bacterium]
MGRCYFIGVGTDPDRHVAAKWFRRAAERGYVEAQILYGKALLSGQGVKVDRVAAAQWFAKAAAADAPEAL